MMSPDDMEHAIEQFNDLLGTSFGPPRVVADGNVLTTTDWTNKIELFGPPTPTARNRRRWRRKGGEG